MKTLNLNKTAIKVMASSEYEEGYDDEYDDDDFEEDEDSEEDSDDSDLDEDENFEDDSEDSDLDEEEDDDDSWEEAIKYNGVFYGDSAIIALICREGNKLAKPIKWKIATREGRKWTVVEEHPLNCDVEAVFGEYGSPMDFVPVSGYFRDEDTIRPPR